MEIPSTFISRFFVVTWASARVNSQKAFVQNQITELVVSSMVNVDFWKIPLRCPKCGIENEVTLSQIKTGKSIQCIVYATKICLKDENGSVEKKTKQAQEAIDELEKALRAMDVKFR